ncbi:DUF423 domain-containing protein [Flavobacteriaceae bacterium SZ-1-7]|uniref:DUF423 domain-containing protein n=1 Tax=Tamlana sedimenti TaxID=3134126 RepID=UPI003129636B
MNRNILLAAAILGATGVILGAFGSHALKELISIEAQQSFEIGVRYQMYHALFLLFVGSMSFIDKKSKNSLFYLTLVGIILFSGSIYGLATNTLTAFDFKSIGFITPIGGLCIIAAWCLLILNLLKLKSKD